MLELDLGSGVYFDQVKDRIFVAEPIGASKLCDVLLDAPIPQQGALVSAIQHTQAEIVPLLIHGGALSTTGEMLSFDLIELIDQSPKQFDWAREGLENLQEIRGFQKIAGAWRPYLFTDTSRNLGVIYLIDPSLRTKLSIETHYHNLDHNMVVRIAHDNLEPRHWDRRSGLTVPNSNEPAVMAAFFGLADMHLCAEGIEKSTLSPKDIARQVVVDVLEAHRRVPAAEIESYLLSERTPL